MASINPISSSLVLFDRAETQMANAAAALANFSSSAIAGDVDTVDLSAQILALLEARNSAAIGAKVARTADEIQKNVIDLLA